MEIFALVPYGIIFFSGVAVCVTVASLIGFVIFNAGSNPEDED
jgi:hypothetical protein